MTSTMGIDMTRIPDEFSAMIGKHCNGKMVGEYRSLTVGFGDMLYRPTSKEPNGHRSEWEIGTYNAAWRIVQDDRVLLGSMNPVEDNGELDTVIQTIPIDKIIGIEMSTKFDVRLVLSGGIALDFLCASSDDDELIHVFGPNHFYAEYTISEDWVVSKSNQPLPPGRIPSGA